MINLGPSWADVHWPDNWTATTVDGRRSAQFEETLLYVFRLFMMSIVHATSQNYRNRGRSTDSKETIAAVHHYMEIYQITVYITLSLSTVQTETPCPTHHTKGNPAPIIDLLILVDCLVKKCLSHGLFAYIVV